MSAPAKTLLDKLWDAHEITRSEDGKSLLWVDRHLVHEGSHHAFARLSHRGARVAEPELTFAVADHYAPTGDRLHIADAASARMIKRLVSNTGEHGITLIGLDDPRQGIVHVIGPELGLTLPGLLINCGDSHTSTHGALGALAFGIGATEVAHVLATQTLWQHKPRAMRIVFQGLPGPAVTAKDLALYWIAQLGSDGATGHAVEYAGQAIDAMSLSERMTLCNLSIEGGARCGLIAPDAKTLEFIVGRPFAPKGSRLDAARSDWLSLHSDAAAVFDREIDIDVGQVAPMVSWGISPEQSVPVGARVPDPSQLPPDKASAARAALNYMDLKPNQLIEGTPVDQVFLGSCTNARLEDIRQAANVLRGRRVRVPGLVSPGSSTVKSQAEQEGLDRIIRESGLTWGASGCSLCVGMNGDRVTRGQRCASSTNRNYRGRQGPGSRTHLMSPAMVAAAAVQGCIVDVRQLGIDEEPGACSP